MTSSNERCEVSRACSSILKISFDERFRNEVLTSLGVTSSAEAEDKMKKTLREVYNGEGLNQSHTQLTSQVSQYIQDSISCSTNIRIQGVEEGLEQEQDNPLSLNEIYEFDFCNDATKEPLQLTTQLKLNDEFEFKSSQVDESLINQPLSKVNNVEMMVEGSEEQKCQDSSLTEIYEFEFDDISSEETIQPTLLGNNPDKWHSKKSTYNVLTSVTEKSLITKSPVTLDNNKEQTNKNNIGTNVVERETSQMMDSTQASQSIFQEEIEDEFDFWNS